MQANKIVIVDDKMSATRCIDAKEIAENLVKKTRELIPLSANIPFKAPAYIPHFLLQMVRCYSPKAYKQTISNLLLILQYESVWERFANDAVASNAVLTAYFEGRKEPRLSNKLYHKNAQILTSKELYETWAKRALKYGVGNCGELSKLLMMLLIEYRAALPQEISYELVQLNLQGDHEFIVLDRDPNSSINSMDTWGKNAIICDPWFGETIVVHEQLALARQDQSHVMRYCLACLNQDRPASIIQTGIIGEGHSTRWEQKTHFLAGTLFSHQTSTYPHIQPSKMTALFAAVFNQQEDLVAYFLQDGIEAELNQAAYEGYTPIYDAVLSESFAILKRLLEAGANPNTTVGRNNTPLIRAIRFNNISVQLLLAANADPNFAAADGSTPLSVAKELNLQDIEETLLKAGASPNANESLRP